MQVPHVSESESSDEQDLTDHATFSTSSEVSEHGNEDLVNPSTGGSNYGVSGPDNADSNAMYDGL